MEKKGKFSLALALIHLILGLAIATLVILSFKGLLGNSDEYFPLVANYVAFTTGPLALLSVAGLFIVLSIEIFICRSKKPFFYFLLPFTWAIYFTLMVNIHKWTGNPNPEFIMTAINNARNGLMLVLLFLEVMLTLVLIVLTRGLNDKYKKKYEFKQKKLQLEREQRQARGEAEPLTKKEIRKAKKEHKKEIAKQKREEERRNKVDDKPEKIKKEKKNKNKDKDQNNDEEAFVVTKQDQEEALVDPDEPITFPSFVTLPEFKTFKTHHEEPKTEENEEEVVDITPSTTPHVFEVMKEERERKNEEEKREKIDLSQPTTFRKGSILEASLEAVTRENEERAKNNFSQTPIVGYDDIIEKKKPKEVKEDSFAPSTLSPSHPRYKMFESLRRKKPVVQQTEEETVTHFPTKPIEVKEEKPTTTYTSPIIEAYEENQAKKEEAVVEPVRFNPPIIETKKEEPIVEKPVYTEPAVQTPVYTEPVRQTPSYTEPVVQTPVYAEPEQTQDDEPAKEKNNEIEFLVGIGGLSSNDMGQDAIERRKRMLYSPPSVSLLVDYPASNSEIDEATKEQGYLIVEIMRQFKVEVELINIIKGPTVTMFEFELAPGVLISKVTGLHDNIALNLGGKAIRILAPVPGKKAVGIEVPNAVRGTVGFKEMMPSLNAANYKVPMVLGKTITGAPTLLDVAKAPHLLIAGTTGSGKSVGINALICSILYTKSPKDVRLMMIDPKIVELKIYNGIPHLLTPVITESKKVLKALAWLVTEMERRYEMVSRLNVRNLEAFNQKLKETGYAAEKLPYIVLIMDEFADLMATIGKDIDAYVGRLTAMSRAVGIHLVMATQRPSAEVITGTIKSNLPSRISFTASSGMNSRIILDEMGAESLLGRGDMLYKDPAASGALRIQGAFLSDAEVEKVVQHAQRQGQPDYLDDSIFEDVKEPEPSDDEGGYFEGDSEDDLYEEAKRICYERKSASASYLQRRMRIGFNKASRFVDRMEADGIIGPAQGSKAREILRYE